jgi:hypothetical protein
MRSSSNDSSASGLERRTLLGLSLGAALGAVAPAAPAAPATVNGAARWTSTFLELGPVENFRQAMRIQRSLEDQADILHWYHFIMVAVPVGRAPVPVVRWEGIELSRHVRIGEHRYRMHGHNLSFPRDLDSGRFVDTVLNPLTGEQVKVPPMALVSDPGQVVSPEGSLSLDAPPGSGPRPKYARLRRESGLVKVDSMRVPPASWPVTFLEMGYEASPAELFDDPRQVWLPSEVSGAYVFPWPEWLRMGDRPGHMFAAWSGHKLRSVEQLPEEFTARARQEFPQLLQVDARAFERPLPGQ